MTKEEFMAQVRRIEEFRESLPQEFTDACISIEVVLFPNTRIHMYHTAFCKLFPLSAVGGYNGNNVELYVSKQERNIFCLIPIQAFVKRFGSDMLPQKESSV